MKEEFVFTEKSNREYNYLIFEFMYNWKLLTKSRKTEIKINKEKGECFTFK